MAPQNVCRLSELPESLLCSNILSRLPLSDAVRSSLLCSQWRYHWTKIPHLHFSPHFFTHMSRSVRRRRILGREAITHIKETMEHILTNHKAPLECFLFHIPNKFVRSRMSRSRLSWSLAKAMDIKRCIEYVAKKEVERLFIEAVAHPWEKKMSLPITVFSCTTLLHLQLVGFIFPEIPTLSENFKLLRVCVLAKIENLTDQRLRRIVELCPGLEKLVVVNCQELNHLKIQAPNLNCLILVGCSRLESVTADCPQLLLLKTREIFGLHELQINSYSLVELNIKDSNELAKVQLNSCVLVKRVGSVEGQPIGSFSDVESLRKLSLEGCSSQFQGLEIFPELKLVGIFPCLEELNVSPRRMGTAVERRNELQEEKVRDFVFPKLNNVYMDLSYYERKEVLAMLGFLLRNSPLLKNLIVKLPYCLEYLENQLLGLKRGSVEIKILKPTVELKIFNETVDKKDKEFSLVGEDLDGCGYFWYENEVEDSDDGNRVEDSESENEMYYEEIDYNDFEVFEEYDYASG